MMISFDGFKEFLCCDKTWIHSAYYREKNLREYVLSKDELKTKPAKWLLFEAGQCLHSHLLNKN